MRGAISPRAIMIGASTKKFTAVPSTTLVATRDSHQSAHAEHGGIEPKPEAERAKFRPEDVRSPEVVLRREHVVIVVDAFVEMPRLRPAQAIGRCAEV